MGVTGKTIRTLQGLPFDNLIGGPLNACILAQAQAAQTTVNFIQEEDEGTGKFGFFDYLFQFLLAICGRIQGAEGITG